MTMQSALPPHSPLGILHMHCQHRQVPSNTPNDGTALSVVSLTATGRSACPPPDNSQLRLFTHMVIMLMLSHIISSELWHNKPAPPGKGPPCLGSSHVVINWSVDTTAVAATVPRACPTEMRHSRMVMSPLPMLYSQPFNVVKNRLFLSPQTITHEW